MAGLHQFRVVHICQRDDAAEGGAVRVSYELVRCLLDRGVDARMLFLYGGPGCFGARLGGRCDYLDVKDSRQLLAFWRLRSYLSHTRPGIVHFHDDLLWPQLITLGRRGWRQVTHVHTGGSPHPRPWKIDILYACHRGNSDSVVCITEATYQERLRNNGFRAPIATVIENGIDQRHFRPPTPFQKESARRSLDIPQDAPVVGFVGRLHDEMKGCGDFVRLIAELPKEYVGLMAGAGPDREMLNDLCTSLAIADRVRFVGLLNDPLTAYHAMDVFCFTSRYEPFGLTIAEAMACRIPVVGFSCPGGSSALLTEETGAVIDTRDVRRLANEIAAAVQRSGRWPAKLSAASALIGTRFGLDAAAERILTLYRTLLANEN